MFSTIQYHRISTYHPAIHLVKSNIESYKGMRFYEAYKDIKTNRGGICFVLKLNSNRVNMLEI